MILAGFLVISSLSVFLIFFFPVPMFLFGHPVRGLPGVTLWITNCLLCAAAGIGLLRLKVWSYWLALGLQVFWFFSGLVTLANPKYSELMQEVLTNTQLKLGQSYSGYTVERFDHIRILGLATPPTNCCASPH